MNRAVREAEGKRPSPPSTAGSSPPPHPLSGPEGRLWPLPGCVSPCALGARAGRAQSRHSSPRRAVTQDRVPARDLGFLLGPLILVLHAPLFFYISIQSTNTHSQEQILVLPSHRKKMLCLRSVSSLLAYSASPHLPSASREVTGLSPSRSLHE